MQLPEVSKLLEVPADAWRSFGARLRAIGFTARSGAPFVSLASRALDPLRAPMAKWHARRVREPGAYALRMLMFWDPVTDAEAREVLGPDHSLERMLEAGLLRRTSQGGIVSQYVVNVADETFIVCDDLRAGGDAVMGLGQTTVDLLRISRPQSRIGSALDLGCGAGAAAILFAPFCERVVGTDINPRAIDLARVNALLNDVPNVEFRIGDLFAPVAGEAFDLVVSQPPFIAHYSEDRDATFLFGGARGDELPLRLLREMPPSLAPGGTAIVLVEWPIVEGDAPLEVRVREAVGPAKDLSVLLLQAPDNDLDAHCASYARYEHPNPDEAYERAAIERRDYFDRMKFRALRHAYSVVRRARDGKGGWTSTIQCRPLAEMHVERDRIDAAVAARDLVARGVSAVLGARLRVPYGVTFTQRHDGERVDANFPEDAFVEALELTPTTVELVQYVNEADTVKAAIERFAAARNASAPAVAEKVLPAVQNALFCGLLEVG